MGGPPEGPAGLQPFPTPCIVGVYGVAAQLARRRMREMGIRIALGPKAGQVQWLVVRHGAMLTAVGIAVGIGVGMAIALGATLVLLTAVAASWLPAVRASRADPCQVLRSN